MSEGSHGQEGRAKSFSGNELLAALEAETVFEFDSQALGTIRVMSMRANTLDRIAVEFEREGADDDAKLRRLLCELGRIDSDNTQLAPISSTLAASVTPDDLVDFARKLLVSEEWASEEELLLEPDPKGRAVRAVRTEMEAAGAAYRKLLDALGPSISAHTRDSIANATRLADKLRTDAVLSLPALRAIESLQKDSSIGKLATSMAQMQKDFAIGAKIREQALRLNGIHPMPGASTAQLRIETIPPIVNPTAAAAKATATSAAKMEEALARLEQRANDSALVIAGIHDIIRDTTLDMARNASESAAATKKSLDQAAASVEIGAQSVAFAKYALFASVGIGFVSLIFAGISAWYAVFPANTDEPPTSLANTHRSGQNVLDKPVQTRQTRSVEHGTNSQQRSRISDPSLSRSDNTSNNVRPVNPTSASSMPG